MSSVGVKLTPIGFFRGMRSQCVVCILIAPGPWNRPVSTLASGRLGIRLGIRFSRSFFSLQGGQRPATHAGDIPSVLASSPIIERVIPRGSGSGVMPGCRAQSDQKINNKQQIGAVFFGKWFTETRALAAGNPFAGLFGLHRPQAKIREYISPSLATGAPCTRKPLPRQRMSLAPQFDLLHQFRHLNQSSPEFPNHLTSIFNQQGYRDCVTSLQSDDSALLIEYLENVRCRVAPR